MKLWALAALLSLSLWAPAPVLAQEHAPAPAAASHEAEASHEPTLGQTVAKLTNFALLIGILVYFLKAPFLAYLVSRDTQIRLALVEAADMRSTATARLADIQRQLERLPSELEALRVQGAEDVRLEQARIKQAAATERDRLLEQTRREIDMRLRIARRELTELAAQLAVQVAEERIKRSITPEDHMRLIDRYAAQLQEVAR